MVVYILCVICPSLPVCSNVLIQCNRGKSSKILHVLSLWYWTLFQFHSLNYEFIQRTGFIMNRISGRWKGEMAPKKTREKACRSSETAEQCEEWQDRARCTTHTVEQQDLTLHPPPKQVWLSAIHHLIMPGQSSTIPRFLSILCFTNSRQQRCLGKDIRRSPSHPQTDLPVLLKTGWQDSGWWMISALDYYLFPSLDLITPGHNVEYCFYNGPAVLHCSPVIIRKKHDSQCALTLTWYSKPVQRTQMICGSIMTDITYCKKAEATQNTDSSITDTASFYQKVLSCANCNSIKHNTFSYPRRTGKRPYPANNTAKLLIRPIVS